MMERNSLKMGNHFAFANGRLYMVDCTLYSNSIKEIRINLSNQKDSTTYDVLGSRNVVIRKNKIGASGGRKMMCTATITKSTSIRPSTSKQFNLVVSSKLLPLPSSSQSTC